MSSKATSGRSGLVAAAVVIAVAVLSVQEWRSGRALIRAAVADAPDAALMAGSDSAHYLAIARTFAAGDLSCSYVSPTGGPDLAHRQPLYPALLALTMTAAGDDLGRLAHVNLVLLIAALWVAYAIGAHALGSSAAGLAAALALWRVPYLFENATTRLLTEPGYVLIGLLAAWGFLAYRTHRSRTALLVTTVLLGLAYLQRVNGMFLAVTASVALLLLDLREGYRSSRTWRRSWAIAFVLLVVVTIPSWLPRTIYAGQPFYHGYLSNYVWVDAHDRAHVAGTPRYDWRTYVREHDAPAIARRVGYGVRRALWEAPRVKYGDLVAGAALLGMILVFLTREGTVTTWLIVGLVQMTPLVWTALSNPIRRIPATALLPFAVVAIAAGTKIVLARLRAQTQRMSGSIPSSRHVAAISSR